MSDSTREFVLKKLNAGEISPGLPLLDRIAQALGLGERIAATNFWTGNISVREDGFKYPRGDLAHVLAHEVRHVQQGAADVLAPFRNRNAIEADANSYACANTFGWVGAATRC